MSFCQMGFACTLVTPSMSLPWLGGSVDILKKNAEALVAATKEIGLEANAHKISTWPCPKIRT